jgi:hypothetical protein
VKEVEREGRGGVVEDAHGRGLDTSAAGGGSIISGGDVDAEDAASHKEGAILAIVPTSSLGSAEEAEVPFVTGAVVAAVGTHSSDEGATAAGKRGGTGLSGGTQS